MDKGLGRGRRSTDEDGFSEVCEEGGGEEGEEEGGEHCLGGERLGVDGGGTVCLCLRRAPGWRKAGRVRGSGRVGCF